MNQFVDFYSDNSHLIFDQVKTETSLPPFMVKHQAMSEDALAKLGRGEFADPDSRLFPICSKAETWTSIAYFNRQRFQDPVQGQVQKQAALSPMSFEAREMIRETLAKAASMWGLDDEEVAQLSAQVNLKVPKKAETNEVMFCGTAVPVVDAEGGRKVVEQFLSAAPRLPESLRRETALGVLKAANAVETKADEDQIRALMQHAGAATCTAEDVVTVLDGIVPYVPHYAESIDSLRQVRTGMSKMDKGTLLPPSQVNDLVASLEAIVHKYNIKNANVSEGLRRITTVDLNREQEAMADLVKLPGGIMARKTAIAENAMSLSNMLHSLYKVEAHRPEEIVEALGKMTPREILPLRNHIGA
jgi:hypothetical protein